MMENVVLRQETHRDMMTEDEYQTVLQLALADGVDVQQQNGEK